MRKMTPVERLLLDLMDEQGDKKEFRIACEERVLPQENKIAILKLLDDYLDEKEKIAIYSHYKISPKEGWDSFEGVTENSDAYATAMSKLRIPQLARLWGCFGCELTSLIHYIKLDEDELRRCEEEVKIRRQDLADQLYVARLICDSYFCLYNNRCSNNA